MATYGQQYYVVVGSSSSKYLVSNRPTILSISLSILHPRGDNLADKKYWYLVASVVAAVAVLSKVVTKVSK